jgi:SagB-type dehydrogenase family enzyme
LEVYLVCAAGLFRYRVGDHSLIKIQAADLRSDLAAAAFDQSFLAQAPVTLVFAALYDRTTGRYGDRGLRYVHIDVGHAAQNVHLQAVALGLGSVPVGAFDDDRVATALRLPKDHRPLYLIPVGRPASQSA